MSFVHGKGTYLSVDGNDISQYLDTTSHDRSQETAEVTAYGDDDKAFIAGLMEGSFSISGHFDATADGYLAGCFDGGTVEVIYGPGGNAGGAVSYTCNAIITSYSQSNPVGDKVSFSANLQRTGPLTRDTFSS